LNMKSIYLFQNSFKLSLSRRGIKGEEVKKLNFERGLIFLILSFGTCLNLFAQEIITGPATLDALIASDHRAWFDKNYQAYQPDISVIQSFPVSKKNISIKIVAGTWCSDSRILLPQFYKVMDLWQFNHQNIELIFTDKNKQVKMK